MSNNPFGSALDGLDLTDANVSEGMPVLKAGIYDADVADFEMKKDRNGNQMLAVVLRDELGRGQITHNFNLNSANAEAKRISRDQLKTLCAHGGHPNPDRPFGGGATLKGLKVRIFVDADGTYTKNNQTRTSFAIKRFAKIDPAVPASGPNPEAANNSGRSSGGSSGGYGGTSAFSDDIPF